MLQATRVAGGPFRIGVEFLQAVKATTEAGVHILPDSAFVSRRVLVVEYRLRGRGTCFPERVQAVV